MRLRRAENQNVRNVSEHMSLGLCLIILASSYENAYDGGGQRSGKDEEFRPFIRRLPEWQFWYVGSSSTLVRHTI